MNGKNAWIEKQKAVKNTVMHSAENLTKQYMLDTLCMPSTNQKDGVMIASRDY